MKNLYLFLITSLAFNIHALAQHRQPNVIIIMMDDMGYGDTEPYGMTGIATPNFNKLTKQSTRFTHYNVAQPICTASRAALLTAVILIV
nr:sulfatase-like hydrolase/transferase [Mucilaginibacter sp. E4BP6]NYE67010.1 arylsulfatase A-like enzyme [Mucilaginibacter sp. E4BP6]